MDKAQLYIEQFEKLGDAQVAAHSARFFKGGQGQYAEGDKFLGIRVPTIREFAKSQGKPH